MVEEINKDFILTHSILNFLRASFLGQMVFHKTLHGLGSKFIDDSYIEGATRALDKIEPWIKELFDGIPIISSGWTAPETFEAIRTFGYLKEVKQDLDWLSSQVEKAQTLPTLKSEIDAIRLLVASLARTANVRAAYLDGVGSFFNHFKDEERVRVVAPQFDDAKRFVDVTSIIFDTFNNPGPFEEELVERLRREASLCPSDINAQAFDAVILQNSFVKNFDYEHSGIPAGVAKVWRDFGVPAKVAGYWIAYKLSPEEASQWNEVGFPNASLAANWKRVGFKPKEAISWINQGFAPALAKIWLAAGFEAERAAQFLARGVTTPDKAADSGSEGAD